MISGIGILKGFIKMQQGDYPVANCSLRYFIITPLSFVRRKH
jgi:hypothetical protein